MAPGKTFGQSSCDIVNFRLFCAPMSKPPDTIPLLDEIEAFLAATGMSPTIFGNQVVRDWRLVDRLRRGGDVTTRNAERIRGFMASRLPPRPAGRRRAERAAGARAA
jgi:hypothetical protein